MFGPITIPFGAKMLLNTVKLKSGVNFDQLETEADLSPARCSGSPGSSQKKVFSIMPRRLMNIMRL
jgi:hypothetical protein